MADSTIDTTVTSIDTTNLEVLANSPAQAMAVVYQVMANTIGLSMQNAQANYANMLQIGTATVAVGVTNILRQLASKP